MDFEEYRVIYFNYYEEFYKRSEKYKQIEQAINQYPRETWIDGLPGEVFDLFYSMPFPRFRRVRGDGDYCLKPVNKSLTVTIDLTLGVDQIIRQLDLFVKETIDNVKKWKTQVSSKCIRDGRSIDLIDFIRDNKGRIDYFSLKGGESFSLWEIALKVYDLRNNDNKNWIQIASAMGIWGNTANCESTARTIVKRHYERAEILIKSAESETFPR